jgi:hypothetical protein
MKLKQITVEQLTTQPQKYLGQAQRTPLVVRSRNGRALVIRPIGDDELADELISAHPRFRASIRRARRNRKAGKGVPLRQVRKML